MKVFCLVAISVVFSGHNSEAWRHERDSEFYKSLSFKSASDNSKCLTRDSSGDNQSFQLIVESCVKVYPRGTTRPLKLEVAKVRGTSHFQLSQAYRAKNKPHGVAGCLIPERQSLYFSKASCDSKNSHWEIRKTSGVRHLIVHITSNKCMTVGKVITTVPCNSNDIKQLWEVDFNFNAK